MAEFLCREEGSAILGACFEVYNTLLPWLSEDIYKLSLCVEFRRRGIPFEREKELKVYYKGELLPKRYFADLVCFGNIIVEAKAVSGLVDEHRGQLLNYMRITNTPVGYLVNFGSKDKLQWQRMALTGTVVERSLRNPALASTQEKLICGNLRQSAVQDLAAHPPNDICGNLRQSAVQDLAAQPSMRQPAVSPFGDLSHG